MGEAGVGVVDADAEAGVLVGPTARLGAAGFAVGRTPDVKGDKIPDIWALMADGSARFYPGGRSAIGTPTTVIASGSWTYKQALG
ncbi:hypothetical protein [Streptomyces sp. NPDC054804]